MPDAAIDALLAERPERPERPERLDPSAPRPAETRPPWFGAVVVAVAVLVLADIVGLAVVADAGPGGGAGLGQVREFVKAQRTATFTGTQDDGAPSRLRNQLTTQGELRLPNESHVIRTQADGSAEEILFHVDERFSRYAPSREELADASWGEVERSPFADFSRENKAAAALAAMSEAGAPVHLDTLLANLKRVRRIGENRLQSEFQMAELIPDELKALAEARIGDGADEGEAEEGEDVSRLEDAFSGTLTVTLEYGEGGRLDVLRIVGASTFDDDDEDLESVQSEEFRFADWGKPVRFTLPEAAAVIGPRDGDANDDAFRSGEARNEESFALLAARMEVFAPAELPRGWQVVSKGSVSTGRHQDLCGVIDYGYGPPEEEDPLLAVASSTPGCELIAEVDRMLKDARRLEDIGGSPAWILPDFPSGVIDGLADGIAGVLDRDGSRVIVATSLDELFLRKVMRELKPADTEIEVD